MLSTIENSVFSVLRGSSGVDVVTMFTFGKKSFSTAALSLDSINKKFRNSSVAVNRRDFFPNESQIRRFKSSDCPHLMTKESSIMSSQNFPAASVNLPLKDGKDILEVSRITNISKEKENTMKTMKDLDGPIGWPIVGNFLMYLKKDNRGKMHEVQAKLHRKYGKMFREKWGSNWQVHLSDPDLIEEVHRHEGKYPNRPSIQSWVLFRKLNNLPNGLTTAQGDEWQLYRTEFGKRLFCPNAIKSLIDPFNTVADDLCTKLEQLINEHGQSALPSQLPNISYLWSLEAAGSFLFETRLGCLSSSIPVRTQSFIDSILDMMSSSLYLIVGEKLHQRFNTKYWQKHAKSWDSIFKIGKQLIDDKLTALKEKNEPAGPYLSHILSNSNVTTDQIHTNITELLMAGSDTTANTLCYMLYELANNPDKQEILRKEIDQVLCGSAYISSQHLEDMKYLRCVIKETMRMHPVVTMNCRILPQDINLNGYLIPKNTLFVLNQYSASMDPDQFSEPEKFEPERWLRGNSDAKKHPFASLPFGYGARSCLGKHVGNMELMVTLTKILKKFDVVALPGEKLNPILRTLLTPGEKVPVKLIAIN